MCEADCLSKYLRRVAAVPELRENCVTHMSCHSLELGSECVANGGTPDDAPLAEREQKRRRDHIRRQPAPDAMIIQEAKKTRECHAPTVVPQERWIVRRHRGPCLKEGILVVRAKSSQFNHALREILTIDPTTVNRH
ncbi:hypothetical protein GCM10027432_09950 [Lysobacter fragariae]